MTVSTYTEKQLLFIMNKRCEGLTFEEVAEEYNNKFHEDKGGQQMKDTFNRHKKSYDLPPIEKHPARIKKEKMSEIMNNYLEFVRNNKYVPVIEDLVSLGFSTYSISNYFGSIIINSAPIYLLFL